MVAVLANRLLLRVLLVAPPGGTGRGARGDGEHPARPGCRHASHAPRRLPCSPTSPPTLSSSYPDHLSSGHLEQVAEPVLVLAVGGSPPLEPGAESPVAFHRPRSDHRRGVEVMHQDDALVAVEEPVAPARTCCSGRRRARSSSSEVSEVTNLERGPCVSLTVLPSFFFCQSWPSLRKNLTALRSNRKIVPAADRAEEGDGGWASVFFLFLSIAGRGENKLLG